VSVRALHWIEQGRVPDALVRAGIRRLLRQRLHEIRDADPAGAAELTAAFAAEMRTAAIAPLPQLAN
jgi:cyclopropane-fatty-acyl-phospholipid synthase